MFRLPVIAVLLLIAGCALSIDGSAQQTIRKNPPLAIDSLYGLDVFRFYCAPCHGRDGKGGGPVAVALKSVPPDLTEISRRNGGIFPKARVEDFVTNGGVALSPAHGTAEMPVWGPTFRSLDQSDTRVKVRIANIVEYVEWIQN
jgi:mono/diheme cytochrome c family protein